LTGSVSNADREEARVRDLVAQVVAEAVRSGQFGGVVLGAPPSPEAALLERWLQPTLSVWGADQGRIDAVADALGGDRDSAWLGWALAEAQRHGLLVVHPGHKSLLLLDGPLAPCFPLGDLWAYQVMEWAGAATTPRALGGVDGATFRRVEEALRQALEEGVGIAAALSALPGGTAQQVRRALAAGRRVARPPLVPKLSPWTVGVDPAP
jgi:hypothetical protein